MRLAIGTPHTHTALRTYLVSCMLMLAILRTGVRAHCCKIPRQDLFVDFLASRRVQATVPILSVAPATVQEKTTSACRQRLVLCCCFPDGSRTQSSRTTETCLDCRSVSMQTSSIQPGSLHSVAAATVGLVPLERTLMAKLIRVPRLISLRSARMHTTLLSMRLPRTRSGWQQHAKRVVKATAPPRRGCVMLGPATRLSGRSHACRCQREKETMGFSPNLH
jgi:hypothetical protein